MYGRDTQWFLGRFERSLLVLVAVVVFVFQILHLEDPPTGYLHSWNQVTTLAGARGILRDPKSWAAPQDVVTRIPWVEETGSAVIDRALHYTVFEEFPLYHLLTAALGSVGFTLELSARVLSTVFFWFGGLFLFLLVRRGLGREEAHLCALLYLSSFPYLFYGIATMSDMAMVTCGIGGLFFLDRWAARGASRLSVSAALLLLSLSGSLNRSVCSFR